MEQTKKFTVSTQVQLSITAYADSFLYITGNVDYRDFLKSFSSNQFVKQGTTGDGRQSAVFDRRPGTQMSQVLF